MLIHNSFSVKTKSELLLKQNGNNVFVNYGRHVPNYLGRVVRVGRVGE